MKKLIYKLIKMVVLALLLLVLAVFALLMLKRFVPQVALVLPFNNELNEFEIESKVQIDKILIPIEEKILNLKEEIDSQNTNQKTGVEKIFEAVK